MRRITSALCLLLPLALAPAASAAPKKKKDVAAATTTTPATPLESDLGKLKWGMTVQEVQDAYIEKIEANYKEKLKGVRDVMKADQLKAQKKQEIEAFKGTFKKFDTQSDVNSFKTSIIVNEISVGAGESLLVITDEKSQRYLFFADGKFYKLFVAYDGDYVGDVQFPDFAAKISDKHGEPAKKYDRTVTQLEKKMAACSWSDTTASLWVEDRRDLYGSVVLVYTSPTGRQVDRAKYIDPPKTKSKYGAGIDDDMINSLGDSKSTPPADTSKTATDPKATKKETPKKEDPKKKKGFDPLEGTGL